MADNNELSWDLASNVEKCYDEVINYLEWTPEYWQFINLLDSLDKSISNYLYSILYNVPDDFYKYLKKWHDREDAESHILKMVLKDKIPDDAKCSINSLIDRYSSRIVDLAKCWDSLSKVEDKLCEDEILPPDSEKFSWIVTNTGKNKSKNIDNDDDRFYVDKVLLLSSVLSDMWIDLESGIHISTSKNNPNNVRKFPYKALYVRDMDVTILINPWFGDAPWCQEATFVFSGDKIPVGIWKDQFISEYAPISIKFDSNRIFQWKQKLKKALRDCQKLEKRIEIIKTKFQNPEVRDDWFSRNTSDRNKFFIDLGNWLKIGYVGIARLFLDPDYNDANWIFKSKHLIFNDENFCNLSEAIFWKDDPYLNILRNKWKFVEILRSVYRKNSADLDKILSCSAVYKKNSDAIKNIFFNWMLENDMFLKIEEFIKKWLSDDCEIDDKYLDWLKTDLQKFLNSLLPKSFDWMIWLLWWNTDCLEWWYLHALFQSENDWEKYFKNWELINCNEVFIKEFIKFLKSVYNAKTTDFKNLISSWWSYQKYFADIVKILYDAFLSGKFKWCFKNTIKSNWEFHDDDFESIIRSWMPKSFDWFIVKLWWDKKCLEWWYAIALLEWRWDEYLKNWEYINENQENFVSFLKSNRNKIAHYLSSEDVYIANRDNIIKLLTVWVDKDVKFLKCFIQWLPGRFKSLIYKLWWNPKCLEWKYVIALLEWRWDEYLYQWKNRTWKIK